MAWLYVLLFLAYLVLVACFFIFLGRPLFLLGSALMVVLVCVRYFQALGDNLFWGTGALDEVRGKEPAFYSYFFDKGWRDYVCIVLRARDLMLADARRFIAWGSAMMNPFAWFLGIILWLVTAVAAIPAFIVVCSVGLVHLCIVAVSTAVAYLAAILFRSIEYLNRAVHRIHGRCPACHHAISLPVYICICGARHKRLIPGAYGSILRRCRCGAELPTLFLFGRNRLHAICPTCEHALNTTILTVGDLFIPIVGGVSSAKSSVMTATLVEFEKSGSGLSVSFPKSTDQKESLDQQRYHRSRSQYLLGQSLYKTTESQVHAIQVTLQDARGHKRLLYAYDAAGETFRGEHALGSLPYYSQIHGLLFLVDPFSLEGEGRLSSAPSPAGARLSPSADSPLDIYDQVVRSLIQYSGRRSIRNIPMAILVTKTDAFNMRQQILETPIPPHTGNKPPNPDQLRSLAIRQWLVQSSAGPLVQSAESYFRNVRYFECSALGHSPGQTSGSFQARGILEPWAWILGESGLTVNIPTAAAARVP